MLQILILTMTITAHDGHAEFRLKWNIGLYNISVTCEFQMKCVQKLSITVKITHF